DAQPIRELDDRGRVRRDQRGARRLEAEDLDAVLRAHRAERLAVERRAAAATADPLLTGAEVVDVAEDDVLHPLSFRDRERQAEERDAALRVQRAVDRIDDDERRAAAEAASF